MGATTISFGMDGKKSADDVRTEFKKRVHGAAGVYAQKGEYDPDYDNHGYEGDWNSIDRLNFLNMTFNSVHEASEYMDEHTEKYTANAAKYKVIDEEKSKRLQTVKTAIHDLHNQLWEKRSQMTPRQVESMRNKIKVLDVRRKEYVKALAEKSKKEGWLVVGCAAT
jgi:hypothetical protein